MKKWLEEKALTLTLKSLLSESLFWGQILLSGRDQRIGKRLEEVYGAQERQRWESKCFFDGKTFALILIVKHFIDTDSYRGMITFK